MERTTRQNAFSRLFGAIDLEGAALGVQMAISVVMALFLALLIRLEYPTWSVFTALMLCMANYVGAVQEKAVLRLIGTVVGGVLGFLATGALQQSPFLYLPLTFVVVAFSVSMFGQSRAPYAFFLAGMTYVVIVSNSQTDPAMASHYALLRIEEVGLGVVVSMVVQVVVFPRYAVGAFRKLVRASLEEIAETLPLVAERFSGRCEDFGSVLRDFPAKAMQMRALLRFGTMESKPFRQDIARHTRKVSQVSVAAGLVRSSGWHKPAPEPYASELGALVADIAGRIRMGFLALEQDEPVSEEWKNNLAQAWAQLNAEVARLRADPESQRLAPFEAAGISVHLLNLRELSDLVLEMDRLNHSPSEKNSRAESLALAPAWPSLPWIQRGIRAAIATVFALVIENWLNPPGGSMMMLCVYTFTALNSLSPNESGDRPAFRQVLVFIALIAGISILLLAVSPALASYSVLNIIIATWAFLFGYWFHRAGGVSVALTFGFMLLVGVISLNGQQPVAFQDIAGFFFGFANGLVISSVAQRLLWPVLPQNTLGVGLQSYMATLLDALPHGMETLPLWRRAEHALFPSKALKAVTRMAGPTCPPDEIKRLQQFISTLQELSWEFCLCTGRLKPILPPTFAERGSAAIGAAKATIRSGLRELADAIGAARQPADLGPAIDEAVRDWEEWIEWMRREIRRSQTPVETSIPIMGFTARFRYSLLVLRRSIDEARTLTTRDYMGDVSL